MTCVRTRNVDVTYNITETITTYYHLICVPVWYSSQTFTAQTNVTLQQTDTYTITIPPFLLATGIELPVPKIPGAVATYYALAASDQAKGNQYCQNQAPPWPAFTPPPTI